jgi:hypothetical protein
MVLLTCTIEVCECGRYNKDVWEARVGHGPIII